MPRTLLIFFFALGAATANAGDWPQILGPSRNGIAVDERIVDSFPANGPRVVWEREVGQGVAGVAVAGGKLVLFHRVGDVERAEAMDARTREVLWTAEFPSDYQSGILDDSGPRCVPVIHGKSVILFGALGGLHCLDLESGDVRWSVATEEQFNPPPNYFGAGSSPIVMEDRVLVNVGDQDGAGIVAFSLETGKVLWQSTKTAPSYSSPIEATFGDKTLALFVTRLDAVAIDPETGDVQWKLPFGQRGPTVNGANPVLVDGHVFLTASYGIGAKYVRPAAKPSVEWESDDVLSSQYTTPIASGNMLYGIHGRQDGAPADLRCIEPKSEKILWSEREFGYATLIEADGKLLVMKTDGELVLAKVNAQRYEELARAELFRGTTRALPALADGYLFVRDESTLRCFDLSAK